MSKGLVLITGITGMVGSKYDLYETLESVFNDWMDRI